MKCLSCGAVMDDDAVFCTQCGSKLDAEPVENVGEVKEEITDIVTGEVEEKYETPEEIKEKNEEVKEKAEEVKASAAEEIKEEIIEAEELKEEVPEAEKTAEEVKESAEETAAETNDTVAAIDEALEALSGGVGDTENIEEAHDIPLPEPVKLPEEPVIPQPEPAEAPRPAVPELKRATEASRPVQSPQYVAAPADAPNYIERDIAGGPAPVYSYPVNQPATVDYVPNEADKAPTKVGAGRLTGAGIIAFFTAVFLILLSLMFCVKLGASGDTLKKRTAKMDINTVLDANYNGKSLSDAIYNEAGFGEASHGQVSKSDFRIYMAKTDLLSYAGEHIKNYTDFIINGESADPSVTTDDMVEFFSSNSAVLRDVTDYEMQIADYNRIRSNLESKDTAKNFSVEEWSNKLHFNLQNANFIFSYVTQAIILGLVIVLLIWIIVVVSGRGKHVVGLYGGIFTWSGSIVFIVGLAIVAGASIAHVITGEFMFYLCASLLLPFGVFAICVGAAEFVIGFIFKRIRRGIRNKEKRNKAVEKALAGTAV